MKIVNVIQRYWPALGGSETWCREVSKHLAAQGHDVSILTLAITEEDEYWSTLPPEKRHTTLGPLDYDGNVKIRRFERSIPIHTVYHGFYKWILDRVLRTYFYGPHSLPMYLKLPFHFKEADVVFLHTAPNPHNFVAGAIARWMGKQVCFVPHFHPDHHHYERKSAYAFMRRCDGLFSVSEFEKDILESRRIQRGRITATGNGIDASLLDFEPNSQWQQDFRERHAIEEDEKLVVFLGRRLKYKGITDLIKACESLAQERKMTLLLVGPTSPWFENWFTSHSEQLEHLRVIDLGEVSEDDKYQTLAVANVLALPSQFEAFGIVFLESWATGTPVVGSDSGAIPSVIEGGGVTAPFGDPAGLAEALRSILDDPTRAEELTAKGREKLESQYTWDRIAAKTARGLVTSRPKPHRILYATNFFAPYSMGGAEIIAERHARALSERGYEIEVFAGRLAPSKPRYQVQRDRRGGLRVHRVNLGHEDIDANERNHDHVEIGILFRELLQKFKPDIVHVHNLSGLSGDVITAARDMKIPVAMTLHDYWGICFKNTFVKNDGTICQANGDACSACRPNVGSRFTTSIQDRNHEVRDLLHGVNVLISPSRFLADQYRANGFETRDVQVIPNGIQVEKYRTQKVRKRSKAKIGYNGYLGPHKGTDILIEAAARFTSGTFQLRGHCDCKKDYLERIEELGVTDRVSLFGPFQNTQITKILRDTDIVAIPSVWPENHPVSIAEAMAAGKPVVASALGGIPEMVRDGETGFVVPSRDPESLAKALDQLASDPDLRDRMGKRARQIAEEEYRSELAVDRLEDLYTDLLAAPALER